MNYPFQSQICDGACQVIYCYLWSLSAGNIQTMLPLILFCYPRVVKILIESFKRTLNLNRSCTLNVKVYNSARKRWLVWKGCQEKASSLWKEHARQLWLARLNLNKPQHLCNNVLWTVKTKVEMFAHNAQQHIRWKPNTAYQHKHLIPTVKHGGGGLMIRACFTATGPQHLAVLKSTMNSSLYQRIPDSDVGPSVWQLKFG